MTKKSEPRRPWWRDTKTLSAVDHKAGRDGSRPLPLIWNGKSSSTKQAAYQFAGQEEKAVAKKGHAR